MKKTKAASAKTGFGAKVPNFGSSKMGKYTSSEISSINLGGQIATNRFQAGMSVPTQHDDDANYYEDLIKIAGDKPSLASGFFAGLKSNAKANANEARRGMGKKYEEAMDWMWNENERIKGRIADAEKEDGLKKKYLPEVLAYARSVQRLDPQSRKATLQGIMERYNRDAGTNYQIVSVDGTDPFIVTMSAEGGGTALVDLRSFFADQPQVQQEIATYGPEIQAQMQAQRQQQEFENNLATQKLDIDREVIPVNRQKVEQTTRRNDLMEQALGERKRGQNIKLNEKLGPRIKADRQFIERAPKLQKIVEDDPELFQSATRAIWDSQNKGDPSIVNEFVKSINAKLYPERAKNVSILVKGINQMVLDVVDGFARPNMYVDMKGGRAVPNLDQPPSGFISVLKDMRAEREFNLNQNLQVLKHLEATGEDGGSLYGIYGDSLDGMSSSANKTPANDGKVNVKRLDTGEVIAISPENAKKAVAEGKAEIVK